MIQLFTIGFTQKSAEAFFNLLLESGVKTIIDIRRNNKSQLAGFAKGTDLAYLARAIGDIGYVHHLDMAPSQELLQDWRKKRIDWPAFEQRYQQEIEAAGIAQQADLRELHGGCLLCSEHEPDLCHRRLLAEHLQSKFSGIKITHLM